MDMSFFLQLTINGILLGGFYALMAAGFSFSWWVTRIINLAHGEFILMGAYLAWFLLNPKQEIGLKIGSTILPIMGIVMGGLAISLGLLLNRFFLGRWVNHPWQRRSASYIAGVIVTAVLYLFWSANDFTPIDPFLAIPLIALFFFGIGYILQDALLNRLIDRPFLTMLLVTFAIKIMLENFSLLIYGADPRALNLAYASSFWRMGESNITVSQTRFFALVIAGAMIIALAVLLRGTRAGQAIRAAAQHRMAARLVGINIKQTYATTFGIVLALTGIAGAMLGTFQPFTPDSGSTWTLRAFAIVALGGLGHVEGVVAAAVTLGLLESYVGGYVSTGWAIAVPFAVLVITLIARPPRTQVAMMVEKA
jgi:branched-chain amino acid transport system permease protein